MNNKNDLAVSFSTDIQSKLKELENVIAQFQQQLFSFAFFRIGSLHDSQDIVQDVFIRFYQHDGCLSSVNNIRHYLFRSISNACTDYLRKSKRYKFDALEKASIPADLHEKEASHNLLLDEEYKRIDGLLSDIPLEQAEVIRLKVMDSFSFVEIAEILEVPVTTVKSRFKYGIDKLKTKVNKSGD
jgi:RNA polymerase sigma-70 factor, ECF subfamily